MGRPWFWYATPPSTCHSHANANVWERRSSLLSVRSAWCRFRPPPRSRIGCARRTPRPCRARRAPRISQSSRRRPVVAAKPKAAALLQRPRGLAKRRTPRRPARMRARRAPVRPREASLSKNQSALSPSLCCARPASNAKSLHRRGLRCRASVGPSDTRFPARRGPRCRAGWAAGCRHDLAPANACRRRRRRRRRWPGSLARVHRAHRRLARPGRRRQWLSQAYRSPPSSAVCPRLRCTPRTPRVVPSRGGSTSVRWRPGLYCGRTQQPIRLHARAGLEPRERARPAPQERAVARRS